MTYTCFAITAPGLEGITRNEIQDLGLFPKDSGSSIINEPEAGGVLFDASLEQIYLANLHLRTASRLVVRMGDFRAIGFNDLGFGISKLPWEQYLQPGQQVRFSVTCHKSRLYHSDAIAREAAAAISNRMKTPVRIVTTDGAEDEALQLILIRMVHDQCTVSIDTSGELLHKRGYRLQTAKAPLRETLAAGVLIGSGWTRDIPLLDPFCGSGTIPIEAALLASRSAPGSKRRFAFFNWPNFSQAKWQALIKKSEAMHTNVSPRIQASDRDEGAIAIARANAERAGVDGMIEIKHLAFSGIEPPAERGWIVTNPPYGMRVTSGRDLRDLYARLGDVLREKFSGWNFAILCADASLFGQTRLEAVSHLRLINGGIPVKLSIGKV